MAVYMYTLYCTNPLESSSMRPCRHQPYCLLNSGRGCLGNLDGSKGAWTAGVAWNCVGSASHWGCTEHVHETWDVRRYAYTLSRIPLHLVRLQPSWSRKKMIFERTLTYSFHTPYSIYFRMLVICLPRHLSDVGRVPLLQHLPCRHDE